GEILESTLFALAAYAPDIPREAAAGLESAWKTASSVASPTAWNKTRDLLHGRIAKLIALQTQHERELAGRAGVRIGRPDAGRILILRLAKTGQGLKSTIDLRRAAPQASGEKEAVAAFQFGAGIFNAVSEERVGGGQGLVSWWGAQTGVNVIPPGKGEALAGIMQEKGFPEAMVEHIRETKCALLFPKTPKMEGGKPRWSWFEIDPETFVMTSVLDDGSHGMVEDAVIEYAQNANSWCVGFLIGVDAALGSVVAFSLTGEEYATVLKMAEGFAMGLKDQLTKIGPNPGFSYGGVTVSLEGVSFDPTDPNGSHEAFGNFSDGYEKGVAFYFLLAAPKAPPQK
ncbi:MAG TPA: hypothetical protein PKM25_17480, partial [Candidatus Ozemobacteraceae bacterium]|nr:hypothetical protein [Candidatus Ozemobacteraceae bacterium]